MGKCLAKRGHLVKETLLTLFGKFTLTFIIPSKIVNERFIQYCMNQKRDVILDSSVIEAPLLTAATTPAVASPTKTKHRIEINIEEYLVVNRVVQNIFCTKMSVSVG